MFWVKDRSDSEFDTSNVLRHTMPPGAGDRREERARA